MKCRNAATILCALVAVGIVAGSLSGAPPASKVNEYDLMTSGDVFLSRYLDPDPAIKYVSKWPIVEAVASLGRNAINAHLITEELNRGLPVDEQPAFRPVKQVINECAQKLGIHSPHLFVRQDPQVDAYVTGISEPHLLVLTSSLYELYKDRPEELRFIVGRELGHIKCGHIRAHAVGRALMYFIQGDRSSEIRPGYVSNLIVGRLLEWYRESEFSADRAGLICVDGDLHAAECALLRLKHGTHEDVLPSIAHQEQIDFLNGPFVRIVNKVKARGNAPFVFDRCLALRQWTTTRSYHELVKRDVIPTPLTLVIDEISIKGIPNVDKTFGNARKCDPIVKAVIGRREFASPSMENNSDPVVTPKEWSAPFYPNTPVFVDVYDYDAASGEDFVGGAMFHIPRIAQLDDNIMHMKLRRDIKKRTTEIDLPQIAIKYHFEK